MAGGSGTKPRREPARLLELLGPAAEKTFAKFGFQEHALLSHWSSIVGATLSRHCVPLRLRFPAGSRRGGTLTVLVDGPAAVEVQHDVPRILERLNTFMGYPAVSILRLQQGVLPPPPPLPPKPLALDSARVSRIAAATAAVADSGLKTSLTTLGVAVSREAQKRQRPPR